MISCVEGKIIFKGERFVIIDANGVGYRIFAGPDVLRKAKTKEQFKLWTHLYLREDTIELYGFLEYAELEFFQTLIQISGIGPKSGLGVLAVAPLDTLKRAIAAGETSYLTQVSGIGKKIAEKIILELRDKLGKIGFAGEENVFLKEEGDILQALRILGYSYSEARDAIKQLSPNIAGTQNRVKEALKILGKS
ncbi:MAG: Holliday junction branch migration protein RuvA [Candidatus Tagabacteria bacterium CG_4_10_14_0_2_um_filter_40_13]|uniref:Holliday junction branch migration complex subunit RuvA n=2 Tax=Candidatus Tagaibacteriota TaxID=1817918 RepID=A0A2M8G8S8_9BACT|nr:MAG: Holliday junction branch migration protein RuvA [Candidatus Tagabacteria bacterium CG11_big_fil_rev_8_21_14_0_20_41_11]PIU99735.1 MAG: Holliday junction branch migration protein RuvA [Candidatus Tagabacteria bacterium CG03_land_8_20_14_0_80_41_22]PIZ56148.1 MAG: Holliday junction branch migration protein RuvA [Candidatus Tagabacteria bacterium CG_4_10_14_0_2_um_filter_40_13]PJC69756.1 MAG: Holliday junction branch migration protein RuvA [Candidatus Tagabacteria bacterium CG_4_8_14_3_um_f